MDWSKFFLRNSLKIIVGLKLAVVVYILTSQGFYFGEKPLEAQDQPEQQAAPEPAPGQQLAQAGQAGAPKEDDADSEDDDDIVVKRRSYLDDLLNLPKIDKSDLKKSEISRFLKILDRKSQQVNDRVKILDRREGHLKSLEKSVEVKLGKLEDEIDFFKQTIQREKVINEERLKQLVKFYEKMTPKKAAPVFEKLDRDLVVALFNRIPKKQTMNILALMNPDKSVELSEYYGRIRSGKEYELLKEINSALKKEFQECKGLPKGAQ